MNRHYKQLTLLALIGGFVAPPLYAEPQVDKELDYETITKKWKCKYCPDLSEEPWQIDLEVGLGHVTNKSFKFGEYNSLEDDGIHFDADINAYYRDDEANYWDIELENLGLGNSRLDVEGGKQGAYKLFLEFDNLEKYNLDTSRTPYSSNGADQDLPGGWTRGVDTSALTDLNTSLQNIEFKTQRRNFAIGGEVSAVGPWSFEAWFKRQTKEGNLPTSFGFGFAQVANLSMPVDYTTDDIELKANYRYASFNGQIALIDSSFKNAFDRFEWDNAFDTPAQADLTDGEGRAGVAPDNSKQQIIFSGNFTGFEDWQLNAMFSYAKLEQNESFLPYTTNTSFVTAALPATSLNGEVEVYTSNLAAHWQATEKNRWHLKLEHHEHDNQTPRLTYSYVTTDAVDPATNADSDRANTPYSFRQLKLKLDTDYKLDDPVTLSGGLVHALVDRTFQSVERSKENTLWAKVLHRIDNNMQYSLKLESSDRSIDNYDVVADILPVANPNMRKFNQADRTGEKAGFNLSSSALESALVLNFSADLASYDYSDSTVGLTESNDLSLGVDLQYTVDEELSFSAFVQNTDIDSKQAGTTWTAQTDDNVVTAGFGMNYLIIEDTLSVSLDLVHAESTSSIDISPAGTNAFPDLTTTRDTITLTGNYFYDENMTIKATYLYEDYDEDNWYLEGVEPDTLSNVISFGNTPPSYSIGVFWLSLQYKF